ncbi:hypothetical protein MJO28_005546 [Puccinia striiformis f. sp. tritici]|uniref:Uncharacterized protein n=2 Tax=Puccinia striiformis TaxID=27350 RepID=A0ACC0EML2_9BASI
MTKKFYLPKNKMQQTPPLFLSDESTLQEGLLLISLQNCTMTACPPLIQAKIFPLPTSTVLQVIRSSLPQGRVHIFHKFADVLQEDLSSKSALHLITLLHRGEIDVSSYFTARSRLPVSFSKTTWKDLKPILGLKSWYQIGSKKPDTLPISNNTFRKFLELIDHVELIVGSLGECNNEAKVGVWVTTLLNSILHFFRGHINNEAQNKLREATLLLGGPMGSVYTMLDRCIVLITGAKHEMITYDDQAQLMVDLEAAHCSNTSNGLQPQTTRGIIYSRDTWEFWQRDAHGNYFKSGPFPTSDQDVKVTLKNFRFLFEATYQVFFEGYVDSLAAFKKRSQDQITQDGVALHPSVLKWTAALDLATGAFESAKSAKDTPTFDDTIEQLHKSFEQLPHQQYRQSALYSEAYSNLMVQQSTSRQKT